MGQLLIKRFKNAPVPHQDALSCRSNSFVEGDRHYFPTMKIGDWLVNHKWITSDQLVVALKEQKHKPKRLGELMVDLGFITSDQLLSVLASLSEFPLIVLPNQILDKSIVNQLSSEIAKRYQMILFQRDEQGAHIAMADPEDLLALDKVRSILGPHIPLIPYHSTQRHISQALETYYPQITSDMHEGEVIRLINDLIIEAVQLEASDIHLSPTFQRIDIHFRQDGLLHQVHTLHKERWLEISVRLKIMGGLDIAESRRPQNGRFSLTYGGREIDFRLSCHPTIHGENFVIRILDKFKTLRSLDNLGFSSQDAETLKRLVRLPQGMILLSGPTGAGKTTTLYALLSHMDATTRNIMTLEEPVEYCLPNIHQTEIREGGPIRFSDGLKSLLRQDPDVIFISEIRDSETAQMALRASMTGHLVLGTIHTQDSFSIPHRLLDLGVSSSLLREYLIAGFSQRLVRRLCQTCRYPKIVIKRERERFSLPQSITHTYQAGSCTGCSYTGYHGREAIGELVLFHQNFPIGVSRGSSIDQTHTDGKYVDDQNLWDKALQKVMEGKTTLEEIDRVIGRIV